MKRLGIILVLMATVAIGAAATWMLAHEHSQPVSVLKGKPSPASQPQPVAVIVAAPPAAAPASVQNDLPPNALFGVPVSGHIVGVIAAPGDERAIVLSADDSQTYSLQISLLDLRTTQPKPVEIVTGSNAEDFSTPVWGGDRHLYYELDEEGCDASSRGRCGLYDLDPVTGKSNEILDHSTSGLALSPDGKLLAFWDYTAGDKLTIYDILQKKIVRQWQGQTHTADDLIMREMSFPIDGTSLLAETYEDGKSPLKEFDIPTGTITTLSPNAGGLLPFSDGTYFMESQIDPAQGTVTHALKRLANSGSPLETIADNSPYNSIFQSGGRLRWASAVNDRGLFLYDLKSSYAQPLGARCSLAVVMADGRTLYASNSLISFDAQICGATSLPPVYSPAMASKLSEMKSLYASTQTSTAGTDQPMTWFSLNRSADELAGLMTDASHGDRNQFSALEKEARSAGIDIHYCDVGGVWRAQRTGFEEYLALLPGGPAADEAWWKINAERCGDFKPDEKTLEANTALYQDFLKRFPNSPHAPEAGRQIETNQQLLLALHKPRSAS